METEKILMGQKQLQRWHLIMLVEGRKMTLREAGRRWECPTDMRSGLGEQSGREGSRGSFMAIGVSLLSGESLSQNFYSEV
jgi:hypothetical protein